MNIADHQDVLDTLLDIASKAGQEILDVYRRDFDVEHKQDQSPLTEADLRAHKLICRQLARNFPEIPVLSEESRGISWDERKHWQSYFLVDPLDGTKEFVKRNGEFTVNIALIDNHVPALGVVHVPVSGDSYAGSNRLGAFRDSKNQRRAIQVRKPASDPLVVVGSRSHVNPALAKRLDLLGRHELVSMGSSLKFCLVAEGQADFYPRLGPTSEWDTAAAQAVVEAAGGRVVTLDGAPLRYNHKENILNPEFLVFGDSARNWVELMQS